MSKLNNFKKTYKVMVPLQKCTSQSKTFRVIDNIDFIVEKDLDGKIKLFLLNNSFKAPELERVAYTAHVELLYKDKRDSRRIIAIHSGKEKLLLLPCGMKFLIGEMPLKVLKEDVIRKIVFKSDPKFFEFTFILDIENFKCHQYVEKTNENNVAVGTLVEIIDDEK